MAAMAIAAALRLRCGPIAAPIRVALMREFSRKSKEGDKKKAPKDSKKKKKSKGGSSGSVKFPDCKNTPHAKHSWWVRDPKTGIWLPEGYVANAKCLPSCDRVENDPSWWQPLIPVPLTLNPVNL